MNRLCLILLLAAALAAPALADTKPVGIGFAQAEEGTWWCRDSEAAKALDCAERKCRSAAGSQDCAATRWCYLAGWSGLMVIWLPEFHNTVALCGAPSERALEAAFQALCAGDDVVTRCDFVAIVDPDGKEKDVTGVTWPGPAVTAPPAAQ